MRFMNEWDVEEALVRCCQHPILGPATQTISNLVEWTNSHSDGWAYWPKPVRAATRLMALIEGDGHPGGMRGARFDGDRDDVTVADYRAALRPIKAFRTRQGADFEIVEAA